MTPASMRPSLQLISGQVYLLLYSDLSAVPEQGAINPKDVDVDTVVDIC